jgi:hypothetical protein
MKYGISPHGPVGLDGHDRPPGDVEVPLVSRAAPPRLIKSAGADVRNGCAAQVIQQLVTTLRFCLGGRVNATRSSQHDSQADLAW